MYLEPGRIPPLDDWVVDYMHSYFKEHIEKRLHTRSAKTYELFLDTEYWKNFMNSRKNEPLMSYLKKHTYPFNKHVDSMWMNYYSTDMKDENGFGGFLGLHQDYHNYPDRSGDMVFVNSVLIDQSKDMVGGEIVLAGDSLETRSVNIRPIDTRDIMHRLKVIRQKPGDVIFWNGLTLHGVGQIEKGDRLTLMVVKLVDWDERYFDRRKFSDPYNE